MIKSSSRNRMGFWCFGYGVSRIVTSSSRRESSNRRREKSSSCDCKFNSGSSRESIIWRRTKRLAAVIG